MHTYMYVCIHTHTHTHTPQVMFKLGDDLRQDQLILQLITLMDRILRRENLDLKLTPYDVLACSGNHGMGTGVWNGDKGTGLNTTQWTEAVMDIHIGRETNRQTDRQMGR